MIKNQDRIIVNNQIRASKILCIDQNNNNIGIIPLSEGLSLAYNNGLDLVQISVSKDYVPTCKILDLGKYKYELSKRQKEADKKQRESAIKTKTLSMRPCTGSNDIKIKAEHAAEFLNDGCRVQVVIKFKGRELAHQEVGYDALNEFMSFLPDCHLVGKPSFDNKNMSVFVAKNV